MKQLKYLALALGALPLIALYQNAGFGFGIGIGGGSSGGGSRPVASGPGGDTVDMPMSTSGFLIDIIKHTEQVKSKCNKITNNGFTLECFPKAQEQLMGKALNHVAAFPFVISTKKATTDFSKLVRKQMKRVVNHEDKRAKDLYDGIYINSKGKYSYINYTSTNRALGFKLIGQSVGDAKKYFRNDQSIADIYFVRPSTYTGGLTKYDPIEVSALLVTSATMYENHLSKLKEVKSIKDLQVPSCGANNDGVIATSTRYMDGQFLNGLLNYIHNTLLKSAYLKWPDKSVSFGQALLAKAYANDLRKDCKNVDSGYSFVMKTK